MSDVVILQSLLVALMGLIWLAVNASLCDRYFVVLAAGRVLGVGLRSRGTWIDDDFDPRL